MNTSMLLSIRRTLLYSLIILLAGLLVESARAATCEQLTFEFFKQAGKAKKSEDLQTILKSVLGGKIAKSFGVSLKAFSVPDNPGKGEVLDQVLWLVRHSGNFPQFLSKKDILERGKIFIAYPLQLEGKMDRRLVIEYKIVLGAGKGKNEKRAFIDKMYVSTITGKKAQLHSGVMESGEEIPPYLIGSTSKKSNTPLDIVDFNKEFEKKLKEFITDKGDSASPEVKELKASLEVIDQAKGLSATDKGLRKLELIKARLVFEGDDSLKAMTPEGAPVVFYAELHDKVIDDYMKFMESYFYSPNRNTLQLHDQQLLQNLKTTGELLALSRKLKAKNFRTWIYDRSTRQVGGIPIGIAMAYIGYQVTQESNRDLSKDAEKEKKKETREMSAKQKYMLGLNEKINVTLTDKAGNYDFEVVELETGVLVMIPKDQSLPLWKTPKVTLKNPSGEEFSFMVNIDDSWNYNKKTVILTLAQQK